MKKLIVLVITAVLIAGVSCASGIQEEYDQTDNLQLRTGGRSVQPDQMRQPGQPRLNHSPGSWNFPNQLEFEKVTVNGIIQMNERFATVDDGGQSYIVPRLNRLAAFAAEVKDGASVSIEGFVFERNDRKFLHPIELSIEGKLIEFPDIADRSARDFPRTGDGTNRPNRGGGKNPNYEEHPHRGHRGGNKTK